MHAFEGKVDRDSARGTVTTDGARAEWRASRTTRAN
jgi:hypothetical protein